MGVAPSYEARRRVYKSIAMKRLITEIDHMAAIAFTDVSRTYEDGRVRALDGVTLSVAEREFLAVVGPPGSGKTTLLQLINRLAEPSSGTVEVDDADVRAAEPIALRRRIGYVFQDVGVFPHMTVAGD